jgi:hypothetical protein
MRLPAMLLPVTNIAWSCDLGGNAPYPRTTFPSPSPTTSRCGSAAAGHAAVARQRQQPRRVRAERITVVPRAILCGEDVASMVGGPVYEWVAGERCAGVALGIGSVSSLPARIAATSR